MTNTTNLTLETESYKQKIEDATEGLTARYFNLLHDDVLPQNKENAMIICNYIQSMKQELNLSDSYRGDVIIVLCNFSMFFKKSFKEGTREDILSFLNSFRTPEALDPLHKWIGTYNIFRMHLMRFFRWLYYPNIYPSKNRAKPPPIENIPQLKRKEKSIYKPTDLWTNEEDSLFLIPPGIVKRVIHHLISSKHVILLGPPGTGKTDLSRRLLHELGTRIIGIRDPIEAVVSYEWGRYDVNQMMSI